GTCQNNMTGSSCDYCGKGVTNTERADRDSTTTTRLCRATGSSDQAAKASVPPRTGSSTSPGPPAGMETVTRPTLPIRLSCAPAETASISGHRLSGFRAGTSIHLARGLTCHRGMAHMTQQSPGREGLDRVADADYAAGV